MTREEEAKHILLGIERCAPMLIRETDDYENEIADLHNRLNIAEYDKERLREEVTKLESENKTLQIKLENAEDVLRGLKEDLADARAELMGGDWND